ncbi:isochorismatase family protein [Cupriavidus necator]|uniref:isochorismatase family protein n=1 Tax=Cupriavidus necator TaxID=106590 RepID=UPI0005B4B2B8|nr:isochorismatase family protein [Cupriavidus necator]
MDKFALDTNYANTGFNTRLGFGKKPALLLIDLVQAYFVESSPLYHPLFEPSLAVSIRLKAAAHRAGIPVVLTRLEVQKDGVGGGVFFEKIRHSLLSFEPGNPLGDLPPGLEAEPSDIVIWKRYASGFFGTALAPALTTLGVDTVLIAGVSTSGCVRATCVDAISHGFRPMVVREAVGDRHPDIQEANLYDMNAKYADVIGEEEAMAYLKQVSAL